MALLQLPEVFLKLKSHFMLMKMVSRISMLKIRLPRRRTKSQLLMIWID